MVFSPAVDTEGRKLKGGIQRSTETGLAVEMPSRTIRQASHESIEDSMNSYGSEGKWVAHQHTHTHSHTHTISWNCPCSFQPHCFYYYLLFYLSLWKTAEIWKGLLYWHELEWHHVAVEVCTLTAVCFWASMDVSGRRAVWPWLTEALFRPDIALRTGVNAPRTVWDTCGHIFSAVSVWICKTTYSILCWNRSGLQWCFDSFTCRW